jgi:hypothetical protein
VIDYRALLKDVIRGMVYEWDIPTPPAPADPDVGISDEELAAFFALVWEVLSEEHTAADAEVLTSEERENVRHARERTTREIKRLEREAFGRE